jgi:hypothetical protein
MRMKKFYSILLAAVSLLCSANLCAQTSVSRLSDLQAAIDATPAGDTVDIVLSDNISVGNSMPIRIYAKYGEAGKTVNLDLNNHDITVEGSRGIEIFKGNLNITGKGNITKSSSSVKGYNNKAQKELILVSGSYKSTDANWSTLTIGKDVNVYAGNTEGKAVVVDGIYTYSQSGNAKTAGYFFDGDANAYYLNQNASATGITLKYDAYYKTPNAQGTPTYETVDYTNQWYAYKTTANSAGTYARGTSAYGSAFGVKVTVYGTVYGTEYGIKINGTLKNYDGTLPVGEIPYVHVATGAKVSCAPTTKSSTAIYSAGYGHFLIEGEAHGATGVYIKSGIVDINNAHIYSENPTYSAATGTSSGITGSGSAIVVESGSSYIGGQALTISGNSTIEGRAGYGVEEVVTNAPTEKVESVKIEGGTIHSGEKGAIVVTDKTAENEKITIVGGNVENNIVISDENGTLTPATTDQFFPEAETGSVYISTTTTDANGRDIIVVVKVESEDIDKTNGNSVKNTDSNGSIIWKNTETTTETITKDKTLTYLQISEEYTQTLIVGDDDNNVTLTIGQVVLGANARLIVNAGSRLVVTGDQGIYSAINDNIVLRTKEGTTSQLLFSPVVISNSHPNATVEFESKSYYNSASDYRNQRFGIPTVGKLDEITSSNNIPVAFAAYVSDKWTNIGRINATPAVDLNSNLNKPFVYYQMSCNIASTEAHPVITMKGKLVGNESPALETSAETYTTFANSYMANLNLTPLYDVIEGAEGVEPILYTYRPVASNTFAWKGYNRSIIAFEERALEPMQAFYVKNNGNAATLTLNYETMIWNARNTEFEALEDAPARRAADNRFDVMARMSVKANGETLDDVYMLQSDDFSAEYEAGWDGEKMMNEDVNFFVAGVVRQEALATDNLNNIYLGFSCKTAGEYTISFGRMTGNDLMLVDLVNGQRINIVEGGEYTFRAEAGESNDYRFQIIGRANMPTDVETVENAAVKGNGIYTITGQYMGNMSIWNTLPAGVYVVDGVKRVK